MRGSTLVGLSNDTLVGNYTDAGGNSHGFIDNAGAFTSITYPNATGTGGTQITGISGSTIVGNYHPNDQTQYLPFIYSNGTYTTISADPVAAAYTSFQGISGNTIVGTYLGSDGSYHGFTYTNGTYTTLNDPLATNGTYPVGIDGSNIVGYYNGGAGGHGFVYNGTTYSSFNVPVSTTASGATLSPNATIPTGISGSLIVGTADDQVITHPNGSISLTDAAFGFVYDGSTFTTIQDPNANETLGNGTSVFGIDGNTAVGSYIDASTGLREGFEVVLPEPASGLLLISGAGLLARHRRRRT